MGHYKIMIKNSAKGDLKKVKRSHLQKRFEEIIEILKKDPRQQSLGFEKLQPPEDRHYSRRLNIQHRVVYTIDDENKVVKIFSAWSHYE